MVRRIIAILGQAVELVKEDDEWSFLGKVHNLTKVGCRLAQEARDHAFNPYSYKNSSQLPRHRRRDARLATAGWTVEENTVAPGHSRRIENWPDFHLIDEFAKRLLKRLGKNQVSQLTVRQ